MKILQIMGGAGDGGAEIFFMDSLLALKDAGIEQYAIIHQKNQTRVKQVKDMDVPYQTASFGKLCSWPTKSVIKNAIKEFKPDIVQYWMGRAASLAVSGDHINIGWHSGYKSAKRFKKCNYHFAVTPDLAKHVIDQNIDKDCVFSLPVYTHEPKGSPISRSEFDTPDDVTLLLSLARLDPVKGLDVLINAMVKIPDAYLWIAGSGPLKKELKEQVSKLNLSDRIRFLGWRDDKEALMATSDIYVFPSRNDSFGMVMIEAWASNKPFIASKAPGPKAYIRHDIDGLLVDIDDSDQLADAVNLVINDTDVRDRLIKNGRERFEKEFSQEAYAKNAIKLYQSLRALK